MPVPLNNITFGRTALPGTQWSGDVSQLIDLILAHLTGTLDNGALVGQIGGTEPLSDIGLWLNNNSFYAWDAGAAKYLPLPVIAGKIVSGTLYLTTLVSGASGSDVTLFLPNKNGATLATVADVLTPAGTKTASGTAIAVDWNGLGNNGILYANLTGNATFTESTAPVDGQRIDIYLEQALAASGALTWTVPSGWVLNTGTPVLQTRSSATTRYIDHFMARKVGATTFVEQMKAFQIGTSGAPTSGTDTTPPTPTDFSVPVNSKVITVTWSEPLTGMTLNASNWSVKKNGVTNPVVSVVASGNKITVTATNKYISGSSGTVAYSAAVADVKDLATNPAVAFAAQDLTVVTEGDSG